jgi:hypothetical protein
MTTHSKNYALSLLIVFTFLNTIFNKSIAQTFQKQQINKLILPDRNEIDFIWLNDSLNGKSETYSALLIPVKIANCPKKFYMQFDLGVSYSMFYENKINSINKKYPKSLVLNDSISKLTNTNFTIGNKKIIAEEIFVKKYGNPTIQWDNKKSIDIIGTLGMDLIQNKTIIINYPKKKIFIQEVIPKKISTKVKLYDFTFVQNSILLPTVIKGKKTMLYFDTGSSAYELLTNLETCNLLSDQETKPTQTKVKSWDKILTATTFTTKGNIQIGDQEIPLKRVTFIDGASSSQINQMMKMGMGGMTGNKLFLEHILIIDTKIKKFGLLNTR